MVADRSSLEAERVRSEVTEETHALLALLVKQHVRSWYTCLSQDVELYDQMDAISAHIQMTLSARVKVVDWHDFFLRQLPELLLRHLEDFNIAHDRCSEDSPLDQSFRRLQTHPGIVDQDLYLMHVADALLVVLLPEHDLMSDVAYAFSREILADLVIKIVIERLSEPWFWDELILKFSHYAKATMDKHKAKLWSKLGSIILHGPRIILSKAVKWLGTRRAFEPAAESKGISHEQSTSHLSALLANLDLALQNIWARPSLYDTAIPPIMHELFRPSRAPCSKFFVLDILVPATDLLYGESMMEQIREMLDKTVSHNSLAKMIRLSRTVLFPDDQPSPTRVVPSLDEQLMMKDKLRTILPTGIVLPFFESKTITKVLLFRVLDAILGTIFPELIKRSPEQLKENLARIRQANVEAEGSGGIRTGRTACTGISVQASGTHPKSPAIRGELDTIGQVPNGQQGIEALQAMRNSFESKLGLSK